MNKPLVAILVGLIALGTVNFVMAAAPGTIQNVFVTNWQKNQNVTVTNPPTVIVNVNMTRPSDRDGDGVPDSVDAFPDNPFLSHRMALFNGTVQNGQTFYVPTLPAKVTGILVETNVSMGLNTGYISLETDTSYLCPAYHYLQPATSFLLDYNQHGVYCYGIGSQSVVVTSVDMRLTTVYFGGSGTVRISAVA